MSQEETRMSRHTPGPWTVYANSPESDARPSVMAKQPSGANGLFYVAQCNRMEDARLIAAAPEMVELLSRATQAPANWEQWMQDARALLARIEGA